MEARLRAEILSFIQSWCSSRVRAADFQSADGVFESSHRLPSNTFRGSAAKFVARDYSSKGVPDCIC